MLDAELLIGRNDNAVSNKISASWDWLDKGGLKHTDKWSDDNAFMEYGLKLQANFSENFYFGLMGLYFNADNLTEPSNGNYNKISDWLSGTSDELDLAQYGAYLSYNFTPSIALRGYYYMQDLDDGWKGAANVEDNPQTWSAMLDIKQDVLKFTSLWVQYVEQDNTWVGPRASDVYPAVFTPSGSGEYFPIGADGTNKTFLVTAEQQWGDSKWSSFLQYITTDWDNVNYDDTDQYMIGVGYQYTPQIKFWLAYNYIDYGEGNAQDYQGNESVILFRTAIDF